MKRETTESIRQLQELAWQEKQKRYPGQPYLVRPEYNDRTANGLNVAIIAWIRLHGNQAERINNTGRPIDRRKTYTDVLGHARQIGSIKWTKGTGTKGTADISATIKGRSVKIEVKIGRDRQSDHQREYQKQVEAAGGIYFIARNFDEFHTWYVNTFMQ
jgi:hypothetical protein